MKPSVKFRNSLQEVEFERKKLLEAKSKENAESYFNISNSIQRIHRVLVENKPLYDDRRNSNRHKY